ncbi:SIMPL domain-containing protein [Nonomuraea sp. NN258]|uniref:SIMPL domain-containing protein n=1 Tax=Nonomuraea antri TaxID=2730852 RepID=UPI0015690A23|nr:SIMPL domain-containing protein [Nonomuraea antri]NRQ39854.1 SIMPL domain-containing protein [Nonomuraea antri]
MDITVTGEGSAQAEPDALRLHAGVEVRKPSPAQSFSAARGAAERLARALRQAGIAEHDVRTIELGLGPEYEVYPQVSAYRAVQGVEVVVRDLSRADQIIDTIAGIGEEARLNGLVFEVSDPRAALREARSLAFADAAAKAAQYAELAGRPLGRVVSVTEEVRGGPQPMPMAATMAESGGGSISPGRQSLSVTVRVGYAFAD